jgi:hypothetical protein
MSQTTRGILGAAAIALVLGAVPLAAGRDFSSGESIGRNLQGTPAPAHAVNRAVKVDRMAGAMRSDWATQTISLQLSGLSDTSVLVRMPAAAVSRNGSSVPSWKKPDGAKQTEACEPVVSALTEVAKLLEPGRCIA